MDPRLKVFLLRDEVIPSTRELDFHPAGKDIPLHSGTELMSHLVWSSTAPSPFTGLVSVPRPGLPDVAVVNLTVAPGALRGASGLPHSSRHCPTARPLALAS